MDTLRPRCQLLSIFLWIWGASWIHFGYNFAVFCDLGWQKEMVSRSMFLVIQGWK